MCLYKKKIYIYKKSKINMIAIVILLSVWMATETCFAFTVTTGRVQVEIIGYQDDGFGDTQLEPYLKIEQVRRFDLKYFHKTKNGQYFKAPNTRFKCEKGDHVYIEVCDDDHMFNDILVKWDTGVPCQPTEEIKYLESPMLANDLKCLGGNCDQIRANIRYLRITDDSTTSAPADDPIEPKE